MLEAFFTKIFTIFRQPEILACVGGADALFPLLEARVGELDALVDTSTPAKYCEAIAEMAKFASQLEAGQLSVDEICHTYGIPDGYSVDLSACPHFMYQVQTMTGLFFHHKNPEQEEPYQLYVQYMDLHPLLEKQKKELLAIRCIRFGSGSVVRSLMRQRLGVRPSLSSEDYEALRMHEKEFATLGRKIDEKLDKIRPLEAALTEKLTAEVAVPAPASLRA